MTRAAYVVDTGHLAFWIEGYYNRERRHSTIGYLSPIDYEQQFIAARTLTSANP